MPIVVDAPMQREVTVVSYVKVGEETVETHPAVATIHDPGPDSDV